MEDAAQAFGGEINGNKAGSFGNVEVKNHILLPDSAIVNLGNGRDLKLKQEKLLDLNPLLH